MYGCEKKKECSLGVYLNLSWVVCSEPFRKPRRYWEVRASAMGRTISQIGGDVKMHGVEDI